MGFQEYIVDGARATIPIAAFVKSWWCYAAEVGCLDTSLAAEEAQQMLRGGETNRSQWMPSLERHQFLGLSCCSRGMQDSISVLTTVYVFTHAEPMRPLCEV